MVGAVIPRRFGLNGLSAARGPFPVDPPKIGGIGIKYIGSFALANAQVAFSGQVDVGAPAPNKVLVAIPSCFLNANGGAVDYVKVNGRNAAVFSNSHLSSSQMVLTGICYIPFSEARSKVNFEVGYNVSAITANYVSIYSVLCSSPIPSWIGRDLGNSAILTVPVNKGSVGVFCTGSGQASSLVSLKNGVVDFDNTGTGRVTTQGRLIRANQPVTAENSDSDGFALAAATWN
ncbi:MAG TPA: hypothetical protein VGN93_31020 [Shinella sp.]|jgi:hypothetical protein|uniref:hypothetical protein n=1 Tax=Shinella sp. TaxID=1870904 RepID=UPI002E0F3D81|nr:hypothetical protein [Shinella sp.]